MQNRMNKQLAKGVLLLSLSTLMLGTQAGNLPAFAQGAQAPATKSGVDTSAPTSITTADELERWMEFYYMHPQPELVSQAVHYADQAGLAKQGAAPLTAFLSCVFKQNSKRIPGWVSEMSDLSPECRKTWWSALWWSNTVEGKEQLNKLATSLPLKSDQDLVLSQMSKPSQPIEQMELNRPEVLDELWGAFSATGDDKYVNRLISTLPWLSDNGGDYIKLTIAGATKWSLVSNSKIHPKVMAALMKARQDQPGARHAIDQIFAEATKPPSNTQQAATRQPQ